MDSSQLDRLRRIEQFELDSPGVRLRFADRLARENGWTVAFARRVITEYKRFCFLAMEAGHPVTPSEHVDQAWHLHLVYTRSYWEEFCPNVLGKPLHHGPTKGGAAESHKHHDWYAKTLASYQRLFGEAPPVDIWTPADQRFHHDAAWRRVNWRDNWVLPKRPVREALKLTAAGIMLMAVVGCAADVPNPLEWRGPEFLAFYAAAGVALLIWNFVARKLVNSGPTPPDSNPTLTDYETAYLQSGPERVFLTATVKLIQRGHLVLSENSKKIDLGRPLPAKADPIEKDVMNSHSDYSDPAKAQKNCRLNLEDINQKLLDDGLLVSAGKKKLIQFLTAGPFLLLFVLGLAKIVVGLQRDKPVLILIGFCVICLITTLMVSGTAPRLTGFGKRLLDSLRTRYAALKTDKAAYTPGYDHIGLPVALFGTAVLLGSPYDSLGRTLQPLSGSSGDSSSSSSSGCSGGDGGGGGSGCGGCGGGGGD